MGTAGTVQAAVLEALGTDSPRHLEVDLADVRFLGSAGINALVRCRAHTAAAGCRMAVTNPQPIVYEVLRITGVLQALAVTPLPTRPIERAGPPALAPVRTAGLRASADSGGPGWAVMPVAATATGADQRDVDVANARACRRAAAETRQAAGQAWERARAMIVDDNARRARMRAVRAGSDGSAPPSG
ncbi:MAG TPA: STAS domain-containing protein [Catenuloplanes sp.]|jgi:anti-anti-sigma factor